MKSQTYKTLTKLLLLILFLHIAIEAQERNSTIIFRNVTLIDMSSQQPKPNVTVVIEGNRILKIGKNIKIPQNAQVIDASGKFMIPGLWDMHVHVFRNTSKLPPREDWFPLFIANGVTSVRDMWTKTESMPQVRLWRKQFDEKPGTVPRFADVGTIVDAPPFIWKNSDSVINAEDGRALVRKLKASGIDFLKFYAYPSRESYFAMVDEAKKLKLPFAGHVPYSVTPLEASNAGQKSIEHLWRMRIACSSNEDKFKHLKTTDFTPALLAELNQSFSENKCREVSAAFAKNGTWQVPTVTVLRSREELSFTKDDRLRYVPEDDKQSWMKYFEGINPARREAREARFQLEVKILKIMHNAGVPLLAGTDLGNPFVYAGSSLHDELGLLAQAGLTPFEALKAATVNPAKYLGLEKSLGTIEKGKFADLILLDANPLSDISNTRKINAVVVNGYLLKRKDLDEMLNKVADKVKQ